jgi:hypothetical protein
MTASIGSQLGSFGKGRQDLGETRDDLAGQLLVVDVSPDRPCPQYLGGIASAFGGQFEQPSTRVLIDRKPSRRDFNEFLNVLPSLLTRYYERLLQGLGPRVEPFCGASFGIVDAFSQLNKTFDRQVAPGLIKHPIEFVDVLPEERPVFFYPLPQTREHRRLLADRNVSRHRLDQHRLKKQIE